MGQFMQPPSDVFRFSREIDLCPVVPICRWIRRAPICRLSVVWWRFSEKVVSHFDQVARCLGLRTLKGLPLAVSVNPLSGLISRWSHIFSPDYVSWWHLSFFEIYIRFRWSLVSQR